MSDKLLTEHQLEFLSLKGGCTGSSESTFVKMQHCYVGNHMPRLIYENNRLEEGLGQLLECEPNQIVVHVLTNKQQVPKSEIQMH